MNRPIVVVGALAAALAAVAMADAFTYPPIVGVASVTDGDTLRVGGVRIRLNGIDAPEMSHPRGAAARRAMREIVGSGPVSCRPDGSRTHGRIVAVCTRFSDGRDIGGELIRQGFALDCARYSGGRYSSLETERARRMQRRAPYC